MPISPLERATDEFASVLSRWRTSRGLSKRALAAAMSFDPSYVSHVEGRRHRPTGDFARRAENVLGAGGEIWSAYTAYEALRQSAPPSVVRAPAQRHEVDGWSVPGIGLIVEQEHAAIGLRHDRYHIVVRRHLHNVGTAPIVRYPVRIRVDRYPNDPRRSVRLHHGYPLAMGDLGFDARHHGGTGAGPVETEAMSWQVSYDADAVKELWIRFANQDRQFPLYPGQRTTIEYQYSVGTDMWGPWFQRAIRVPTRELRVELVFPVDTRVAVWGTVSSLAAENAPLATPIASGTTDRLTTFTWSERSPLLGAAYRFDWRLREN